MTAKSFLFPVRSRSLTLWDGDVAGSLANLLNRGNGNIHAGLNYKPHLNPFLKVFICFSQPVAKPHAPWTSLDQSEIVQEVISVQLFGKSLEQRLKDAGFERGFSIPSRSYSWDFFQSFLGKRHAAIIKIWIALTHSPQVFQDKKYPMTPWTVFLSKMFRIYKRTERLEGSHEKRLCQTMNDWIRILE